MSRKITKNKDYPTLDKYLKKITKNNFIKKKIETQIKSVCGPTSDVATATNDQTIVESSKDFRENDFKLLQNKLKISEQNLKVAKCLLRKTSDLNLEKDFKIQNLTKQTENIGDNSSVDNLFQKYSTRFDCIDMLTFRSVGPGIGKDSTFVYGILKSLYKKDFEKLQNRSATGKKNKGQTKHEITIEKKEIIKNMLIERVGAELCDRLGTTKEYLKRVGRFNELLRHSIINFVRKQKREVSRKKSVF